MTTTGAPDAHADAQAGGPPDASPGHASLTRPYVLTGGRTRGTVELPIEAVVVTEQHSLPRGATPEVVAIVDLCTTPCSVVEIAARLGLALGVVRVLVADLAEQHILAIGVTASDRLDERVRALERLLEGVREL